MNLSQDIEKYILDHSEPESDILRELNRETNVHIYHPRMLSGHLQGRVLKMLSSMIKPENVLEIGTYTGYSAICLAEGLQPNGKIHTIEINDELEDFIRPYIKKAGFENKIILHFGDALKIIPTLNINFDLVFIDGDKREYIEYYNSIINSVIKGGYIIADNVLWDGKVTESNENMDEQTLGIVNFNKMVQEDIRVSNVIFPIRDGMMIMQKH
jgi:predicted O-methyltransferase YrrM